MAWVALLFSLISLGSVVYFYYRFREQQEISMESLSNRVSSLLTEFNRVSTDNIELLDEHTEDLRRVIELANLKIDKLNKLIDQAEGHRQIPDDDTESDQPIEHASNELHEQVIELSEEGLSHQEIAEETELQTREVSVMLRLHDSAVSR